MDKTSPRFLGLQKNQLVNLYIGMKEGTLDPKKHGDYGIEKDKEDKKEKDLQIGNYANAA